MYPISARAYLAFLAVVAIVGWAFIEGVIWLVRFLAAHMAWVE